MILTTAQLACIAGLIGLPAPTEPVIFHAVPPTRAYEIAARATGIPGAVGVTIGETAVIPDDYATRTNPVNIHVHEAVHVLFRQAGVEYDWREENVAARVANVTFEAWCAAPT